MQKSSLVFLTMLTIAFSMVLGCRAKDVTPQPPMLHVTAADVCGDIVLKGKLNDVEYDLERPSTANFAVACYGFIEPQDVGRDFPVIYDKPSGLMHVTLEDGRVVDYAVRFAKEVDGPFDRHNSEYVRGLRKRV